MKNFAVYSLALAGFVFLAAAPAVQAQETPDITPTVMVDWPYFHDSGTQANTADSPLIVDSTTVTIPGAGAMRLKFGPTQMGAEDYIQITSNWDGHSQKLFPHNLVNWQNASAFFNGESVTIHLVVMPGSTGRYGIRGLVVEPGGPNLSPIRNSICGATDDRVLSQDWRALRGVGSSYCSAWTINSSGCMLTAGHCLNVAFQTVEAEVPLSTSTGAPVHPAPNLQWPIDQASRLGTGNGTGDDYGVGIVLDNGTGMLPSDLYGWFTLAASIPPTTTPTRNLGYGSTTSALSTLLWDLVLKDHVGPLTAVTGGRLQYAMDTTGGNSGGVVINDVTGEAIGIHTHGGCNATGGANSGTAITHAPLVAAIAQNGCVAPTQAPTASFSTAATSVLENSPVTFMDTSAGIPQSWDWDLDGDGLTDSTQRNPVFSYTSAGTYDVSLTVTNSLGSDTITIAAYITVSPLASVSAPFSEDFSAGLPGQGSTGWSFTSDTTFGRFRATTVGNAASPVSGGNALVMDSSTDGNEAINSARLLFDVAAGDILSFQWKHTGDENDVNDGFWMEQGGVEVRVIDYSSIASDLWTAFSVDLSTEAANAGFNIAQPISLIWRQDDNFTAPTDGHSVDDIDITNPQTGFFLTMATTGGGVGDLNVDISNLPAGTTEGFTVFSLDTAQPVGAGALFGLTLDQTSIFSLSQPAFPGSLFHWVAPAGGLYPESTFSLPAGSLASLSGVAVDAAAVALAPGFSFLGTTNVTRVTF